MSVFHFAFPLLISILSLVVPSVIAQEFWGNISTPGFEAAASSSAVDYAPVISSSEAAASTSAIDYSPITFSSEAAASISAVGYAPITSDSEAAASSGVFDYASMTAIPAVSLTIALLPTAPATVAAVSSQDSASVTAFPTGNASVSSPPSPVTTGPPGECSIYFEYVSVLYFPTGPLNTACLTAIPSASMPSQVTPAGSFQSPSVYVIFPQISAGNSITQVGSVYTSVTISLAPGELSSIQGPDGPTKSFNFNDLPCPPSDVAAADSWFYNPEYNPSRAYAPMIAPPPQLFDLDPAFSNCVAAIYQGFDPPIALLSAAGLGGQGGGGHLRRHRKARIAPRIPVQTPPPV